MTKRSPARAYFVPLIPLYRVALSFRDYRLRQGWEPVRRLRFPVVSIGNLSTGGAGKTPFAIALAEALKERGFAVDVLSRGYGRKNSAARRIDFCGTADDFGDEPLLIARKAGVPVYVARERYDAGVLAETEASRSPEKLLVHILDDGFQHRQLYRDVNILLVTAQDRQDRLLPAGNLREPYRASKRADVIAIPAGEPNLERELQAWGWKGPVWRMRRSMEVPPVDGAVVAFCGIARPLQFFAGLEQAGMRIADRFVFRDHHPYTSRDTERLQRAAMNTGAKALVTTQKDEVRLRPGGPAPDGAWLPSFPRAASREEPVRFFTAKLRVEIEDAESALEWLASRLRGIEPPPRV